MTSARTTQRQRIDTLAVYPVFSGASADAEIRGRITSTGITRSVAWLLVIALGAIQVLVNPYRLSSEDAVSYLDIADAYLHHQWKAAINGYWSPLYSWVLALGEWIAGPSAAWEFPVVRIVNLVVYLLAFAAFDFFLRQLIASHETAIMASRSPRSPIRIPRWIWMLLGYVLFLWSSLKWIGLRTDTPDMCTAALVYVAAGILLGARSEPLSRARCVALGVVIGFAYLSKTAMFPVAFAFLLVGGAIGGNPRRAVARTTVALGAFALVVLPFIVSLSVAKRHVTFGESGKMNYAWLVNPGGYVIPGRHWQGGPPGSGTPKHPTRVIWRQPDAFEFDNAAGGTYPPWTNPSYWYDGLQIQFSAAAELRTMVANGAFYSQTFLIGVVAFYASLACAGAFWASLAAAVRKNWRLLIPAAAGLTVYMMATNLSVADIPAQHSTRYIAPFVVLLFGAMMSGVRLADSVWSRRVAAAMTVGAVVLVGGRLSGMIVNDVKALGQPWPEQRLLDVVAALHRLGVQPGDKAAILGLKGDHEFWARLARVKLVSEIPDGQAFLRSDPRWQAQIRERLAGTGAKVLIYKRPPGVALQPDWQRLDDSEYYMSVVRQRERQHTAVR